jgi:hypothetical protein
MAQAGGGRYAAADDLAKVADLLRDEGSRRSLASDTRGTLKKAGVDPGNLPSNVINILDGMSPQEMTLLANLSDVFSEAGLVVEGPKGGTVFFF